MVKVYTGDTKPDGVQVYEWTYSQKETLSSREFLTTLLAMFKEKQVVSVGEYHDELMDNSFMWILGFEREILEAYQQYQIIISLNKELVPYKTLKNCLPQKSQLLERLSNSLPNMTEMKKMHIGRLFAIALIPLAKSEGFNDLVLEGVNSEYPEDLLQLSKDKVGDLLRIVLAMNYGMKIHGAFSNGIFSTPVNIGDELYTKTTKITDDDPKAKVLIYNGAMHNMTQPFEGKHVNETWLQFDVSNVSYAPRARQRYGDDYASIDLFNGDRLIPSSHYRKMQEEASEGITCYTHGIDQKTFIIK